MSAHVSSTRFLPGVTVGLYPILTRPGGPATHKPEQSKKVPKSGQVVFRVRSAGEAYWLGGEDASGNFQVVQSHSKAGDPVDVRATLAKTRPPEPEPGRRIVGARSTTNTRGRRRK